MQCTRETTKEKLYEMILKRAGIEVEVSSSKTVSGGWKLSVKAGARGKSPITRQREK